MNDENFYQFSTLTVLALLAAFYGGTYLLTLLIKKKKENTDAFMVSNPVSYTHLTLPTICSV